MALVELNNASLTFCVSRSGPVRTRDRIVDRLRQGRNSPIVRVHALRNIDLELHDGDRMGIVGLNGAGKSTLLKVLADIYPLSTGRRRVEGRISSLFDIILGFELDATGWENIAYRGYLQGETRRSIRAKMRSIAQFSELGRYLDIPVRYYSAGMRIRLAFSISTAIEPDILLVDEAFNAGDMAFREKARERLGSVMSNARIVVAVSHEHEVLRNFCERVLWLDQGSVRLIGPADQVLHSYCAACRGQGSGAIAA
jgi:ABC-type polysaccharide/polyol phosphate transport system ATPase subunit